MASPPHASTCGPLEEGGARGERERNNGADLSTAKDEAACFDKLASGINELMTRSDPIGRAAVALGSGHWPTSERDSRRKLGRSTGHHFNLHRISPICATTEAIALNYTTPAQPARPPRLPP
ncbi:hypothetical protein E2562_009891 [Oryza meyeriana var. granulata]|uniref:Uncharacterized protein n=1 Tax=Oryza meyeriana var. granulata TaxID=110450 RepID=A0A6G1BTP4_9ORYZ|nr:hypothetical protein E2562_009891 [Oryza meyeriana var. granulata]